MIEVSVKELIPGKQLGKSVYTKLGGKLFLKGHVLSEKDLQVLQSFFIEKVTISSTETSKVQDEREHGQQEKLERSAPKVEKEKPTNLSTEARFKVAAPISSKHFKNIESGSVPNVMEIRQFLIPFVEEAMGQPRSIVTLPILIDKNHYLAQHALAVAVVSALIAEKAGWKKNELPQIMLAGYLHNIGQLRLDPQISKKTTRLTEEELREVRKHPIYSYKLLKDLPGINEGVKLCSLLHHERIDGSGYPNGFKGEKIHPYAKIVAIADIYVAMCSERMFKKAASPFLVLEQLKADSFGKLDPQYVHAFEELIKVYLSIGRKVVLNNGDQGEIVYVFGHSPTRPIVRCNETMVNLQEQRNLYIEKIFF